MANIRDFYMRAPSDPKYRPDQIEVYDEIEASISQVRMTLLTNRGEVLGEPGFGIESEKYLFEFELDPFKLAEDANNQISKYVGEARKRKISAKPQYITDEKDRKVYVLSVSIDGRRSPFAVLYD
jgi:hypothetical protein